jgi:phenylpropionate dioxygenase-like ring-hydroxylating dioxygenase large terminal subunit
MVDGESGATFTNRTARGSPPRTWTADNIVQPRIWYLVLAWVYHPGRVGQTTVLMATTYLRNLWYYALPGRTLRAGAMIGKTLLEETVLIGRGADGTPFALENICPHRGMPLSYGKFDGEAVECCYHGWRFDRTGTCRRIPSLVASQRRDLTRIRIREFPCAEVQGGVWVYFRDEAAPREPDPRDIPRVPGFEQASYRVAESTRFPCDVDHAVVGLMDPAHGPFVHRSWWWRPPRSIHEKAKAFAASHLGFTMVRHAPSTNSRAYRVLGGAPRTEIRFQLPSVRIEHVQAGRHALAGLTAVTPIGASESEVNHVIYWTMPWLTALTPLVRPFARAFLNQDRRIVERQQSGLAHSPRLMLIDDADTQAKWYFKLKSAYQRWTSQGGAFENPVTDTVLRWRS